MILLKKEIKKDIKEGLTGVIKKSKHLPLNPPKKHLKMFNHAPALEQRIYLQFPKTRAYLSSGHEFNSPR